MEDIKLKYINISEFEKEVYSYYLDIFPEEERKPLQLIKSSYERKITNIIEILCENEIVGFMLLNRLKDRGYAVLDYLAIFPQYRNNEFGTKALKILLEQEKENNGIFVEIEKIGLGNDVEDNLSREKRKKFYEKLGFRKLNFDLVLFDVIYTPYIFSNINEDEDIIISEIFNIYEAISGKERIKQNCKIIKKLRFEEINKDNIKIAAKLQYEIFPKSSAYSVYKSKVTGERKDLYMGYIAYMENEPVGVTGIYEIPGYEDTAWLSWFGIKKQYRKLGYGKQILEYTIKVAKNYNKKYLRLYTFEIWNSEAQKFYKKNMDLGEYYYNEKEHKDIFLGKPKIFSKSLCDEKTDLWNNKFINISADEDSHEKSVLMMKEDKIIEEKNNELNMYDRKN